MVVYESSANDSLTARRGRCFWYGSVIDSVLVTKYYRYFFYNFGVKNGA